MFPTLTTVTSSMFLYDLLFCLQSLASRGSVEKEEHGRMNRSSNLHGASLTLGRPHYIDQPLSCMSWYAAVLLATHKMPGKPLDYPAGQLV